MSKIKNILILGFCTFLSGAINYATYPILIRHLSLADFAEFSVYSNLMAFFLIPTFGFSYHILILARNHPHRLGEYRQKWKKFFLGYGILYALGIGILLFFLRDILGLHSLGASILIMISLSVALFSTFFLTILQAREKFLFIGIVAIVLALVRFLTSLSVYIIPDVALAVASIILPGLVAVGFYYIVGSREISLLPEKESATEEKPGSLQNAILIVTLIIGTQNIDIIAMKYLFPSEEVALYAAVSVITKFALVIIALFDMIYLPSLLDRAKRSLHLKYVGLLLLLSFLGFGISYFLLPSLGEWVLASIRPELSGGRSLFFFLGVAATSLGFFTIFVKALTLTWKGVLSYFLLAI